MRALQIAVLILTLGSTAAATLGAETPPIPFDDWGACPFECCTYRAWRASAAATAYTRRAESSPVAFSISKGENVRAITGVVVTMRSGIVKPRIAMTLGIPKTANSPDPVLALQPGEILYTLHYLGEGYYLFWYKGGIYSDEVPDSSDDGNFDVVSKPETEWWAKIKNASGHVGWTKMTGNFTNVDACG